MSDENHNQVEAEVQPNPNEFNQEDIVSRLEQLEQTNQRLLNESKTYKDKYKSLKEETEGKERQQLEESQNFKALYENEKNKNLNLVSDLKKVKGQTLREKINFEVARYAKDAYDANDVITAIFSDAKDKIQIDEENLVVDGIKEAVEFVKEKKPYFFDSKKAAGMPSNRPSADVPKPSNYEEELKLCKSQKELEQVMRKHGRI